MGFFRFHRTIPMIGISVSARCRWNFSWPARGNMLMQASRNGYFFVLDCTNGKSLLTVPFGPAIWNFGAEKDGRFILKSGRSDKTPDGRLIAPDEGGLHELPLAQL